MAGKSRKSSWCPILIHAHWHWIRAQFSLHLRMKPWVLRTSSDTMTRCAIKGLSATMRQLALHSQPSALQQSCHKSKIQCRPRSSLHLKFLSRTDVPSQPQTANIHISSHPQKLRERLLQHVSDSKLGVLGKISCLCAPKASLYLDSCSYNPWLPQRYDERAMPVWSILASPESKSLFKIIWISFIPVSSCFLELYSLVVSRWVNKRSRLVGFELDIVLTLCQGSHEKYHGTGEIDNRCCKFALACSCSLRLNKIESCKGDEILSA